MAEVVSVSSISTADIVEVVVEKYLLPSCYIVAVVSTAAVFFASVVFLRLLLFRLLLFSRYCCCSSAAVSEEAINYFTEAPLTAQAIASNVTMLAVFLLLLLLLPIKLSRMQRKLPGYR
jgi:hypothetical protein